MFGPPVLGAAVLSEILLIGQAPGDKEPKLGRPFAWTAGKNLFKWFATRGVDEATFRANVTMAAVCRCFPGKNPKGGDRVPDDAEIAACRPHLEREIELVQPQLLLPIGRLAIEQFVPPAPLVEQIGRFHEATIAGRSDLGLAAAASLGRVDLVSHPARPAADRTRARAARRASCVAATACEEMTHHDWLVPRRARR